MLRRNLPIGVVGGLLTRWRPHAAFSEQLNDIRYAEGNDPMPTKDLSQEDVRVLELVRKAAEQYEQYLDLNEIGCGVNELLETTWDHDPNASLVITANNPSR